jgi:hypothetical protein
MANSLTTREEYAELGSRFPICAAVVSPILRPSTSLLEPPPLDDRVLGSGKHRRDAVAAPEPAQKKRRAVPDDDDDAPRGVDLRAVAGGGDSADEATGDSVEQGGSDDSVDDGSDGGSVGDDDELGSGSADGSDSGADGSDDEDEGHDEDEVEAEDDSDDGMIANGVDSSSGSDGGGSDDGNGDSSSSDDAVSDDSDASGGVGSADDSEDLFPVPLLPRPKSTSNAARPANVPKAPARPSVADGGSGGGDWGFVGSTWLLAGHSDWADPAQVQAAVAAAVPRPAATAAKALPAASKKRLADGSRRVKFA